METRGHHGMILFSANFVKGHQNIIHVMFLKIWYCHFREVFWRIIDGRCACIDLQWNKQFIACHYYSDIPTVENANARSQSFEWNKFPIHMNESKTSTRDHLCPIKFHKLIPSSVMDGINFDLWINRGHLIDMDNVPFKFHNTCRTPSTNYWSVKNYKAYRQMYGQQYHSNMLPIWGAHNGTVAFSLFACHSGIPLPVLLLC